MFRSTMGRFAVIAFILLSYAFFALPSMPLQNFTKFPYTPYHLLTEGFLAGHLSFTEEPLPELLKLKDPYDPAQNARYRLHDASLYHGKYYLYFGPLPVLTVLLPIKLATGYYAPETLAIFLFASVGFIFSFLLLMKVKDTFFNEMSEWQLYFAGLLLGLANNSAYLFSSPRFYENAGASSFCFMSIALYFLLRIFTDKNTWQNTAWFSTFLTLSAAGRPNFMLAWAAIPLVAYYLVKKGERKSLFALFIPAICAGLALGWYNYLRFGSFIEFGRKYQVTSESYFQGAKLISPDFIFKIPEQFYFSSSLMSLMLPIPYHIG